VLRRPKRSTSFSWGKYNNKDSSWYPAQGLNLQSSPSTSTAGQPKATDYSYCPSGAVPLRFFISAMLNTSTNRCHESNAVLNSLMFTGGVTFAVAAAIRLNVRERPANKSRRAITSLPGGLFLGFVALFAVGYVLLGIGGGPLVCWGF
jgi:hypothetical protein